MKCLLFFLCFIVFTSCEPQNGDVKLVEGTSRENGLLMVYYNSRWDFVCDNGGFFDTLGKAACLNLKGTYLTADGKRNHATSTYWLGSIKCQGDERNLDQCQHSTWGVHNCGANQHVYVSCALGPDDPNKKDGDIALGGGTTPYNGLLMVLHDSRWDFVSSWNSDHATLAQVACRSLNKAVVYYKREFYLRSSGSYWVDRVKCKGTETNFNQCPHGIWGSVTNARYSGFYFYVVCGQPPACEESKCADGDVQLVGGTSENNGLLMVYYQSSWEYVCDRTNDINAVGQVACRNLNGIFVSAVGGKDAIKYPTNERSYLLDNVQCRGTETNLGQCLHDPWGSASCGTNQRINVTCALNCGNAKCDTRCIDTPDGKSYACLCDPGHTLDSDGFTCNEIDECLVDNGGCTHTCINTVGSYHCECPRYLHLAADQSTCTAEGITVDCSSSLGMTISLDRKQLFFLPQALTLTNTSCTSKSNSTHIWLYTDYNSCSTIKKILKDQIIYSNSVLDSKVIEAEINYFDSIKIPFRCELSTNGTIIQGVSVVPQQHVIMRIDEQGPLLDGSMMLLDGDKDNSTELLTYAIKQSEPVYVKLTPNLKGLIVNPWSCEVLSQDKSKSRQVITNRQAANFLVKVLPSDSFRFSYPVFTFSSAGNQLHLECYSSLSASSSLLNKVDESLIVTADEVKAAISGSANSSGGSVQTVITSNLGVGLQCGTEAMELSLSPSIAAGLVLEKLQPLREFCPGFSFTRKNGNLVYKIPLSDCGAEVTTDGSMLKITNSLVYPASMTAVDKSFTEATLTHSCRYPLADYANSLIYSVKSNSFAVAVKNEKQADFDVNLKVFSDEKFQQLVNNGGAVSIAEGKQLFGDIGVSSSDPNLKVALNQCKASPTNNPDDPDSQVVIENGCKTSFGAKVFSPNRFSIVGQTFSQKGKSDLFIHCSVVVCDSSNLARCEKRCGISTDTAVGKREVKSPAELFTVSAGPFVIRTQ